MKLRNYWIKGYYFYPAVFIIFSAFILIIGYLFYDHQKISMRQEKFDQLAAIADLKVRLIENWRKERMGDAAILLETPFIAEHIQQTLSGGGTAKTRREILDWMESLRRHYQYHGVLLLDPTGGVRLAVPTEEGKAGPYGRTLALEAIRERKAVLSDLYQIKTGPFRLTLAAPISTGKGNKRVPVGVLLLRVDPQEFLFPLVQTWPTPSPTSESFLVRREGENVLFLTELRHRKNAPLAFQLPVSQRQLPAAMAVLGREGVVEGIDHRGVPVLAALRRIPDSPWYLVAKTDREEVYGPIRASGIETAVVAILLGIGGALTLGILQQKAHAKLQKETAEQAKQQAKMLDETLSASPNIIYLCDREGRCNYVNSAVSASLGLKSSEIRGKTWREVGLPAEVMERIEAQRVSVFASGERVTDITSISSGNDAIRYFDYALSPVHGADGIVESVVGTFSDITERRESEHRVLLTNSFLRLLTKTSTAKEYLEAAADLIRNWSGCRCAGIRKINEQGFAPYESSVGFSREFLESESRLSINRDQCICLRVLAGKPDPQDAPMMTTDGSFCCGNTFDFVSHLSQEEQARYRGVCIQNGFRSVAVIPVRNGQKVIGALHLADERGKRLSLKDIQHLESITPLIGEAVMKFALEEELRESEGRLRFLSSRLLTLQEEERKRISRDVHDNLAASVAAVKLSIEATLHEMGEEENEINLIRKSLESAASNLGQVIKEVLRIQMDLRSSVLDDLGLLPGLAWLIREFEKAHPQITITEKIDIKENEVLLNLKIVIYRNIQEALNNIAKHSQADRARLTLVERGGKIELTIEDNGQGFEKEETLKERSSGRGFGIPVMIERAETSGGSLIISSTKGEGTTITSSWPIGQDPLVKGVS